MPQYVIEYRSPLTGDVFIYHFRGDQIQQACQRVHSDWQRGLLCACEFGAVCKELVNVIHVEQWEEKRRQRVREIGKATKRSGMARKLMGWILREEA